MIKNNIEFKDWILLSPKEQETLYSSWNKYEGEGENIAKEVCNLFKKKFGKCEDVFDISYGIYHGGDWVISVGLRVGYKEEIPDIFHGIVIKKMFKGLSRQLKEMLRSAYNNNIEEFVDSETNEFLKYFNFSSSSNAKKWLIEFVKKYKDE